MLIQVLQKERYLRQQNDLKYLSLELLFRKNSQTNLFLQF